MTTSSPAPIVLCPEHAPLLVYRIDRVPTDDELDAFVGDVSARTFKAPRNAIALDCTPVGKMPRALMGRLVRWTARQDPGRFRTWVCIAQIMPSWLDRALMRLRSIPIPGVSSEMFSNLDDGLRWARARYDERKG